MLVTRTALVDLYDDEAGEEGETANAVEAEVVEGSRAFLGRGVRGLEDEGALG